jgi:hypothetical protein
MAVTDWLGYMNKQEISVVGFKCLDHRDLKVKIGIS